MNKMRKGFFVLVALLTLAVVPAEAGGRLELKSITEGEFRAEAMAAVEPLADGESYAQKGE